MTFIFCNYMNWILIALIGYALLAATFVLDKYILSSTTIKRPSVYAFYSTIIMWGALVLLCFHYQALSPTHIVFALFSGVTFGLGLLTLYCALKGGETTHVIPFNGAVVIAATYTFSSLFLREVLSSYQLFGLILLLLASVFLSYQETQRKHGYSSIYWWAVLSGILFGASHVMAKYIYTMYDFVPAFAWTRAGAGIVGLLLLLYTPVRRELRERMAPSTSRRKKKIHTPTSLMIVWINKISGIVAVVFIQYAAALGSVSLVQAMSGLQYALMFAGVYILTTFFPKIFKEYLTLRELAIQLVGLVLVILGSLLFI